MAGESGKAAYDPKTGKVSVWQPPTENEFNHDWVRPGVAEKLLERIMFKRGTRQRYIMDRLKGGLIVAVARDAESRAKAESYTRRDKFAPIPPHYWDLCGDYGDEHFWYSGDRTFEFSDLVIWRFLDIRFPPDWYEGSPSVELPVEPSADNKAELSDIRPPLSRADAERFCKAILAGWGDEVTQDWAYDKAVLFFPEKRITRDTFRSILRSIRGPMKPGKRGKMDD